MRYGLLFHRWLLHISAFDSLFLLGLSIAALQYTSEQLWVFPVGILSATSLFTMFKNMSTWFSAIRDSIDSLAMVMRDRK